MALPDGVFLVEDASNDEADCKKNTIKGSNNNNNNNKVSKKYKRTVQRVLQCKKETYQQLEGPPPLTPQQERQPQFRVLNHGECCCCSTAHQHQHCRCCCHQQQRCRP